MRVDPNKPSVNYYPLGDAAVVADFGGDRAGGICPEVNRQIREVCMRLEKAMPNGLIEYVPAFSSITFYYEPSVSDVAEMVDRLAEIIQGPDRSFDEDNTSIRTIPVHYGGDAGPDLAFVAAHNHLEVQEVIDLHTQSEYRVYMIGFAPGFPYLGGMDERIATPRKADPSMKIAAGSVGIAGPQTGVYPLETPGGWQVIGRTPLDLFDVSRAEPALLKAGDRVRFQSISEREFEEIRREQGLAARDKGEPPADAPGMEVVKPGLLTTIQDLGRYGYQRSGMSVSGAMDALALRIGNLLLGNPEGDAALECTVIGPVLRFESGRWIVLAGGDLSPMIDGVPAPMWRPVYIPAGSVLSFGRAVSGCRSYICIAGGLAVPEVLSSRSTYLLAGIGGWKGRALLAGDRLSFSEGFDPIAAGTAGTAGLRPGIERTWSLAPGIYPDISPRESQVIRVVRGPEFDWFSDESLEDLLKGPYTIGVDSDRMGYRLDGPVLSMKEPREMLSSAVTFGTVQVPAGGQPIVLMADRQTTGGYPRIAHVVRVDLPLLSQLKPGEHIRFEIMTWREARRLFGQMELQLSRLRLAVQLKRER